MKQDNIWSRTWFWAINLLLSISSLLKLIFSSLKIFLRCSICKQLQDVSILGNENSYSAVSILQLEWIAIIQRRMAPFYRLRTDTKLWGKWNSLHIFDVRIPSRVVIAWAQNTKHRSSVLKYSVITFPDFPFSLSGVLTNCSFWSDFFPTSLSAMIWRFTLWKFQVPSSLRQLASKNLTLNITN